MDKLSRAEKCAKLQTKSWQPTAQTVLWFLTAVVLQQKVKNKQLKFKISARACLW